jgi:formate/nitrite transporter
MLSGLLLEDALLHNAVHKNENPRDKTFLLGLMAGFWVGLSGTAALSVGGGIPEAVRDAAPILPRFGLAFFFPFALHLILLFGGELFTGNTMLLAIGWYNRVVPLRRVLINWLVVYIGNFCGCLIVAYFLGYLTHLFEDEPFLSYVQSIAYAKTRTHGWGNLFLRAIPANVLVCMAVVLGIAAEESAGKVLCLWFPVVLFVLASYEHSVANMFFVNIGLMYGADSSIGWMFFNQSAVALGNFVGGAIVMAGTTHAMNHWHSPLPWEKGHEYGTVMAHDVESTRKAKEDENSISPVTRRRVKRTVTLP